MGMKIALSAHDKKKELLTAFCIAYQNILAKHELYATRKTGTVIQEATGLQVNLLSSGVVGTQQMIAKIAFNELDIVIFFRDTYEVDEEEEISLLTKNCDTNTIPYATNIATAEILIKGLERGDMQWRETSILS